MWRAAPSGSMIVPGCVFSRPLADPHTVARTPPFIEARRLVVAGDKVPFSGTFWQETVILFGLGGSVAFSHGYATIDGQNFWHISF